MGNTESTENNATDSSSERSESGVFIGKSLEKKMMEEFNAKIHAEFLQRTANRRQQQEANAQIQSDHADYLGARQATFERLDQRMEELNAKFKDQLIATDYDASALQQKYVKQDDQILGTEAPCSDVRNNYAKCQKNAKPGACEIYIQALQDCVTKVISEK